MRMRMRMRTRTRTRTRTPRARAGDELRSAIEHSRYATNVTELHRTAVCDVAAIIALSEYATRNSAKGKTRKSMELLTEFSNAIEESTLAAPVGFEKVARTNRHCILFSRIYRNGAGAGGGGKLDKILHFRLMAVRTPLQHGSIRPLQRSGLGSPRRPAGVCVHGRERMSC